jgi:flagellum-specific peptidoglycan hydrolase FlgJ
MMKKVFLIIYLLACYNVHADDTEAYIKKYRKTAIKEMKKYDIPASITLAQGILESASGTSRLAKKGKNHFGIKCTSDWTGKTMREDDDKKDECFRKYRKAEDSFRDHSVFLAERERYKFLFEYDKRDYKAWAYGLKKAGYATNPSYPELLIGIIEKHDLHRYDKKSAKKEIKKEEKYDAVEAKESKEKFQYHEVKKGDTLYSIAKKYNMNVQELMNLNGKSKNEIKVGEQIRVK